MCVCIRRNIHVCMKEKCIHYVDDVTHDLQYTCMYVFVAIYMYACIHHVDDVAGELQSKRAYVCVDMLCMHRHVMYA
jgi:hypothetical protein